MQYNIEFNVGALLQSVSTYERVYLLGWLLEAHPQKIEIISCYVPVELIAKILLVLFLLSICLRNESMMYGMFICTHKDSYSCVLMLALVFAYV